MKTFYGFLLILIGLFNIVLGYEFYRSDYIQFSNFFHNLVGQDKNKLPYIIISVGAVYLIIGIISISLRKSKNINQKSRLP